MPWQSQAQQAFGTGTQEAKRKQSQAGQGGTSNPWAGVMSSPAVRNLFDVQLSGSTPTNSAPGPGFGPYTVQQVVEMRDRGEMPQFGGGAPPASPGGPAGEIGANSRAPMSPEQASVTNAAAPGYFTGSPAIGYPNADLGIGKNPKMPVQPKAPQPPSVPPPPPPPPPKSPGVWQRVQAMAQAEAEKNAAAAQTPVPPAGVPAAPAAPAGGNGAADRRPDKPPPSDGRIRTSWNPETGDWNYVTPEEGMYYATGAPSGGTRSAAAPGDTKAAPAGDTAAADTSDPDRIVTVGGKTYLADVRKPNDFKTWAEKKQAKWLASHTVRELTGEDLGYDPETSLATSKGKIIPWTEATWANVSDEQVADYISRGTDWTKDFWAEALGFKNWKEDNFPNLPELGSANYGGKQYGKNTTAVEIAQIEDPGLAALAQEARRKLEAWEELTSKGDASQELTHIAAQNKKDLDLIDLAMGRYGGDFLLPWEEQPTQPPPDGDGDGGTGGTGGTGTTPLFPVDPRDTTIEQDIDTSRQSLMDKTLTQYFGDWRKMNPEEKTAAIQLGLELQLAEDARERQQKGINIYSGNLDFIQNNPIRAELEKQALGIARDPNAGLDIEGERNRYASDSAKGLQQAIEAMSASGARRGLAPGALTGMAGQMTADSTNATSRGLSEIAAAQAQRRRQNELQGLSALSGTLGQTVGGESMARQMLAQAVMGQAQKTDNPLGQLFSIGTDIQAIELERKAQEEAEDAADWQKYLAIADAGLKGAGAGAGLLLL